MLKPSPLQAIAIVAFLFFYGFAVFALTRDYYLRHPPRVAAPPVSVTPHASAPVKPRPAAIALADDPGIPTAVVEGNPVLLAQQADELFSQGRYAEAIPVYQRVLVLAPTDLDAHNDLGLALHYSGQTQAALDVLARGTTMDPKFQRIWLTYGFVLTKTGDTATATSALTKARDLDPNNGVGQEAARLLGIIRETVPTQP